METRAFAASAATAESPRRPGPAGTADARAFDGRAVAEALDGHANPRADAQAVGRAVGRTEFEADRPAVAAADRAAVARAVAGSHAKPDAGADPAARASLRSTYSPTDLAAFRRALAAADDGRGDDGSIVHRVAKR